MTKPQSEVMSVPCSWIISQSRAIREGDGRSEFDQAFCYLDGATCIPGRFERRSDCPDDRVPPRSLAIVRTGEMAERGRPAVTIIIPPRRLIG